tara:strand:- start:72 stop:659 length:588 start_codon:yes stop_codon:yes gene_type:complete
MRILLYISFITIIFSCNSEIEKPQQTEQVDYVFDILDKDFENDIAFLSDKLNINLKSNKLDSSKFKKIKHYDNLTNDYIEFLSEVENEFKLKETSPFINGYQTTEFGEKYISETKIYREEILKIVDNKDLRRLIKFKFQTDNPIINDSIHGSVMVSHIDYYFKGVDKKLSFLYFKNKKRNAITLENEFLTDLLLE